MPCFPYFIFLVYIFAFINDGRFGMVEFSLADGEILSSRNFKPANVKRAIGLGNDRFLVIGRDFPDDERIVVRIIE